MSSGNPGRKPPSSIRHFLEMKERGEKIVALTAYDFLFARILEEEGVDLLLVGDSLGQVVLGYESTLPVTLDDMIHHARAVRRGAPGSFIVLDLPFMTFQVSVEETLRNAGRVMQETGVQAVKLEGGHPGACEQVRALVHAGVPVMGHLGLTPQSVHALGGYRVQGRGEAAATRLREEALALEEAGCFAIVLELVPAPLAAEITRSLEIPTIGIGAGPDCDGQVLVLYDALGLNEGFEPRFLKRFADLAGAAREGVGKYLREVRAGAFPDPDHSFPAAGAGEGRRAADAGRAGEGGRAADGGRAGEGGRAGDAARAAEGGGAAGSGDETGAGASDGEDAAAAGSRAGGKRGDPGGDAGPS